VNKPEPSEAYAIKPRRTGKSRLPDSGPALNAHVKQTDAAHNPEATHWVVQDTWNFDKAMTGFETREEAELMAGLCNSKAGTTLRFKAKEVRGSF